MARLSGGGTASPGGPHEFDFIVQALHAHGYVVVADVLPAEWLSAWFVYLKALEPERFRRARIGRRDERQLNRFVRGDEICWLDAADPALYEWFRWVGVPARGTAGRAYPLQPNRLVSRARDPGAGDTGAGHRAVKRAGCAPWGEKDDSGQLTCGPSQRIVSAYFRFRFLHVAPPFGHG